MKQTPQNNDAALNAAISRAAQQANFAEALAAAGQPVIVMDETGRMIRREPDGTTTPLE